MTLRPDEARQARVDKPRCFQNSKRLSVTPYAVIEPNPMAYLLNFQISDHWNLEWKCREGHLKFTYFVLEDMMLKKSVAMGTQLQMPYELDKNKSTSTIKDTRNLQRRNFEAVHFVRRWRGDYGRISSTVGRSFHKWAPPRLRFDKPYFLSPAPINSAVPIRCL